MFILPQNAGGVNFRRTPFIKMNCSVRWSNQATKRFPRLAVTTTHTMNILFQSTFNNAQFLRHHTMAVLEFLPSIFFSMLSWPPKFYKTLKLLPFHLGPPQNRWLLLFCDVSAGRNDSNILRNFECRKMSDMNPAGCLIRKQNIYTD